MTAVLTENLPLIAAAPGGVKTLRALILDLAVRGKLVPQNPSERVVDCDVAASQLRSRGKKGTSPSTELVRHFDLPTSWRWRQLGSISTLITDGEHATPPRIMEHEVPLVTAKNVRDGFMDYQATDWVSYETAKKAWGRCKPIVGDILLVCVGATTGRLCVLREMRDMVLVRSVALIRPSSDTFQDYLALALRSPPSQNQIWGSVKVTAQPCLYINRIVSLSIPLPPLAEQHRIVARVDELMALCDRLDAQQADAEAAHATLVKTLLDTLTQSQDADDFAANWQRLSQHFNTIFTTEASLDALKQTLQQLAVMGKLVRQESNDEPASSFLGRIKSERARLIAKKQIKADKPQAAIPGDELPFTPPSGWDWVRFDEVVLISGGLTLGRTFAGRDLVSRPYLRVANVQRGHLVLAEVKEVAVPPDEVEKYRLLPQDLLITEGGDWDKVGRTAIWRGEIGDCLHQNHVFKARPFVPDFNDRWTEMYLNSAIARSYFAGASKQTTNLASINMTQLKACLLPIPPLAEQHRIVAKVDELMALCDALKARLAESRTVQAQLATALVERAVAA